MCDIDRWMDEYNIGYRVALCATQNTWMVVETVLVKESIQCLCGVPAPAGLKQSSSMSQIIRFQDLFDECGFREVTVIVTLAMKLEVWAVHHRASTCI